MFHSALFLLVIGTAYLEAQGIWEPFRRRLSFEASNPPFDVGRPFDLRRIAGISSEGKYVHVLETHSLVHIDLADVITRNRDMSSFMVKIISNSHLVSGTQLLRTHTRFLIRDKLCVVIRPLT